MTILKSLALIVAVLPSFIASQKQCFYPDGKNATEGLVPCYPNKDASHCCRSSDVCLANLMCFSPGLGSVVRRGCTDSSWKSIDCPDICVTDTFRSGSAVLTPCGSYEKFCCGQDKESRSCCDTGGNFTLPGGLVMCPRETPTSTSLRVLTTSITSTTTMSVSPATAIAASKNPLKTERGVVIGLTVAFGCALLAAAALAAYWWRKLKRLEESRDRLEGEKTLLQQQKKILDGEKKF